MERNDVVAAADRVLSRTHRWRVSEAESVTELRGSRRSIVQRVPVEGPGAPGSVIVKAYRESFDAFVNEAAAADFLGSRAEFAGFGPALLAVDPDVPLVVLEDLGTHPSLADALLGSDDQRAADCLLEWARSLGRLHAETLGWRQEFETRRARLGDVGVEGARDLHQGLASLREIGDAPWGDVQQEVEAVAALGQPGALDAFTPSDTCPDNNAFTPVGLRFFDFEGAGFRHALLDAAYLRIAFPTCWCTSRLPPTLSADMEDVYRRELARAARAVDDKAFFAERMARACAWWVLVTTGWLLPGLLERDLPLGPPGRQPATRRQSVVYRLELFADLAIREWDALHGLAALFASAATELRRRWPHEDCELPLYPPFR